MLDWLVFLIRPAFTGSKLRYNLDWNDSSDGLTWKALLHENHGCHLSSKPSAANSTTSVFSFTDGLITCRQFYHFCVFFYWWFDYLPPVSGRTPPCLRLSVEFVATQCLHVAVVCSNRCYLSCQGLSAYVHKLANL